MVSRRRLLAGLGGAAGVGVLGGAAASQVHTARLRTAETPTDAWPMARYDAANRGVNPSASPPTNPTVAWRSDAVDPAGRLPHTPPLRVVADRDRVYVAGVGLVALHRADGRRAWMHDVPTAAVAVHEGTVYASRPPRADADAVVLSVDAEHGRHRWRTSHVRARNHVVVGTDTVVTGGPHAVAGLGRDGTRRWRRRTDAIEGGPALQEGALYVAAADVRRFARPSLIDAASGDPGPRRWSTGYVGHATPPAVDDGTVVAVTRTYAGGRPSFATASGAVAGIETSDGTVRWNALAAPDGPAPDDAWPRRVTHPPVLFEDAVVVGTELVAADPPSIRLVTLSRADGSVRCRQSPLERILAVVGVGGSVVVGGGDGDGRGVVLAIDRSTGDRRWAVSLDAPVAALAPVDGAVFAATTAGRLAAIR
jgi:outer membrane protein assembly factor BamB